MAVTLKGCWKAPEAAEARAGLPLLPGPFLLR
jgi:hypothetical protein